MFFTIIPVVNITIRRLHDVNQSGWLALLMLVPIIGPLVLLNWTVKVGDPEENRFGKPQYTEPVDENLSARLGISTSPTRSTDCTMIVVLLVSMALAWYGNYNIAEGVFNVIRGGEFKAAARYSKAIKSEEKSYGLEARISVERFFERSLMSVLEMLMLVLAEPNGRNIQPKKASQKPMKVCAA